jgi:Mn-containing catalase
MASDILLNAKLIILILLSVPAKIPTNLMIDHRTLEELGFLREKDLVHCLFRRFMEAYEYLSSSNNNPEWALRQFSKFIQLNDKRNVFDSRKFAF